MVSEQPENEANNDWKGEEVEKNQLEKRERNNSYSIFLVGLLITKLKQPLKTNINQRKKFTKAFI